MKEKPHTNDKDIDEAVRDICSVSVAPASKSQVRDILIALKKKAREEERAEIENIFYKRWIEEFGYEVILWSKDPKPISFYSMFQSSSPKDN